MKTKLGSVARDTLIDTIRKIKETDTPRAASALAYTTILSIIPLLAVSFSIFKAFGGLDKLYGAIEPFIFENLAEGSDEKTLEMLRSFVGNIHAGTLGAGGMLGLLLTSMSMLSSIEKSINKVWQVPIRKTLFQRVSAYWFFITLGPLALSMAIGTATALDVPMKKYLPSGLPFFAILIAIFYGMYKYVPHRRVHWKAAMVSAFLTSLSWVAAKMVYGIYVRKVVTYSKIYGSLGAIPIFLLWIYVAWLVILSGAALSSSLQSHFLKIPNRPAAPLPAGQKDDHEAPPVDH
jgi:membrane protein